MAKIITQETFDGVVKENMVEFEMSAEEAVKDAVEQFEAQNVNLANIIKDPSIYTTQEEGDGPAKHALIVILDKLQSDLNDNSSDNGDSFVESLNRLKEECDKDLAHRLMAGKNGAYPILFNVCQSYKGDDTVFHAAVDSLVSLCNSQPDLLHEESAKTFCDCLEMFQNKQKILQRLVELIRITCVMHEANRQLYVSLEAIPKLVNILEQNKGHSELVIQVCTTLRVFTLDDDIRAAFGKGHEHAKIIVTEHGALQKILNISKDYKDDQAVLGELFLTLSRLAVRNEFCQEIMDLGGLNLMMATLENNLDHPVECHDDTVTKQVLIVLKSVAGNDEVKRAIMQNHGGALLPEAIGRHVRNAGVVEVGCACVATVCLRQPDHGKQAVEAGAPEVILKGAQLHPKNAGVQRQVCMAIRNMVSRSREQCKAFLDLGAEELLLSAMNHHPEAADEAKAALRDLGCNVKLTEQWTGTGKHLEQ